MAIARYLVVYLRRGGADPQLSPWLEGRNHLHPAIHRVQDAVAADPTRAWSLSALAGSPASATAHLSRLFNEHVGMSIVQYVNRLRVARAEDLVSKTQLDDGAHRRADRLRLGAAVPARVASRAPDGAAHDAGRSGGCTASGFLSTRAGDGAAAGGLLVCTARADAPGRAAAPLHSSPRSTQGMAMTSETSNDPFPHHQEIGRRRARAWRMLSGFLGTTLIAAAAIAADKPPPLPRVESAVEIGTLEQNPLVLCRDGSYSTLIGGRPVWTFGDTCLAKGGVKGDTFIDNTLAWGQDLDASNGIVPEPRPCRRARRAAALSAAHPERDRFNAEERADGDRRLAGPSGAGSGAQAGTGLLRRRPSRPETSAFHAGSAPASR